ncbi:MAG: PLP-dependent transferase [Nitriliruptoraceae bacterium]|nr:PLP-dependent transferase [Nitriliruptoraceae bacterium]
MTSTHGDHDRPLRVKTRLALLGRGEPRPGQPLNVPIIAASNFHASTGPELGRGYARNDATPGWEAFEALIGDLEGGAAVALASGIGAIAAVLDLLPAGGRVLVPEDSYTGMRALVTDGAAAGGRWKVTTVDMTRDDALFPAIADADLVWLESPSNPMMHLVDIAAVTAAAADAGALVAVDSTFATPLLQSPLELGADLVVHSATKFIGGHSDLLLGVVACATDELHAAVRRRREVAGATPGALECFLALRGARTLALRLAQAQATATALATRLEAHPVVQAVHYPGLRSHPRYALGTTQMRGPGAVLSFEVADAPTADALCEELRVVTNATSLGGVETTIERRAKLPGQQHVPAGLLRLAVGCEHLEDLWDDLDRTLHEVTAAARAIAG